MTNPLEFWLSLTIGLLLGLAVFFIIRAAKHLLFADMQLAKNYFWLGIGAGLLGWLMIFICNILFP